MTPDDQEIDRLAEALGPLSPPPAEDDVDLTLLQAYHAGTLDEGQVAAVEGILAADPAARAFLEELDEAPAEFRAAWATKHGLDAVAKGGGAAPTEGRGRLVRLVFPTVFALAAAALIFIIPNQPTPPPGYELSMVRGDAKDIRSDDGAVGAGPFPIDGGAELTLGLTPKLDPTGTVQARAFVDGPDGALAVAGAQGALTDGGAWRLDAPARALFGTRHGARTLHVAFAFDGAVLDDLAGEPLPSTGTDGGVRWMTVRFEYRAEGADR